MINLQEEKFYFYNDLAEYKNSLEGKAVQTAFKSNDLELIEKALNKYYYCRNVINKFTYNENTDLENAKIKDKDLADLLHTLD